MLASMKHLVNNSGELKQSEKLSLTAIALLISGAAFAADKKVEIAVWEP